MNGATDGKVPPAAGPRSILSDERGLVGRVLVLTIVVLVVFGLVVVEGGSILFATLQLQDTADAAASDAAATYRDTHSFARALQTAKETIADQDSSARLACARTCQFSIDPNTGVVTLTVKKTATTVLIGRIGWLRRFGVVHATAEHGPPAL